MWWLDDDSLIRGGTPDRRSILFRPRVPLAADSGGPTRKRRPLDLTDAQQAANQLLLEVGSEQEAAARAKRAAAQETRAAAQETRSAVQKKRAAARTQAAALQESEKQSEAQSEANCLRADIASLERAVRQQHAQRIASETQWKSARDRLADDLAGLQQSSRRTLDQLCSQHQQQSNDLRSQLTEAETRATEQASECKVQAEQNRRLRQALASAEQKLRQRDTELSECQSQADRREQQHSIQLAEIEHRHAAECKLLQGVAEAAETRASERKEEIATQRLEIAEIAKQHRIATESSAKQHHAQVAQITSELDAAHRQVNRLASELSLLKKQLGSLEDEKERAEQEASTALGDCQATAQLLEQRESEHAVEVEQLKNDIATLSGELERSNEQHALLVAGTDRERAHQSDTISGLSEQLQAIQERLRQSKATALDWQQQAEESRESAVRWEKDFQKCSADRDIERLAREQRIVELQQSLQHQQKTATQSATQAHESERKLRAQCDELSCELQKSISASSQKEEQKHRELADLRESLSRQYEERQTQWQETERQLRAMCDALGNERDETIKASNRSHEQHRLQIEDLQHRAKERDEELHSLWEESERLRGELDQRDGSIERMTLQSEQLIELHDSQFTTLHSRIDELVVELESERQKRSAAEDEAKRLSVERSRRIAFLGQQRTQLVSEMDQLQDQLESLRGEVGQLHQTESRLRDVLATTDGSLAQANERLLRQADQIEQLRGKLDRTLKRESRSRQENSEKIDAAQAETDRLLTRLELAEQRLAELHQQRDAAAADQNAEILDFAIAQRDRTIALLEQEAIVIQERLQREAAARRKAEGVIKRKAQAGNLDPVASETWSRMDADDRVQRLQRQANALRSINLLERQRALTEIARYKREIERLKRASSKRAA